MPSTDDRIVQMQFDSAAFEKKVADVISSLDKLKTSLDFSASKKGMEDLSQAGKSFDLSGMSHAVEGISEKFTAMGAIAFTVLQNVVNRAVDAGIQIAKSLSLDQVISGFHEYETNINSIQTIMSNTRADGTTLNDVNAALDQLNQYSDQTIYNFSQMARNIGTFTAAGVDLDTSVGAIKGIANLAAVSGSSAEQASSAMYQLSQALASGKVRLIDWISVRNAGMGGEVFQKALFETGKAMGAIKDIGMDTTFESWAKANGGFAATLEQDWLSTEVLTATLQGFTGDLTEAQLLAMGYTEAQAAEIQAMGQDAKDAATKVKTFTQLLGTLKETVGSGWAQTFRTIFGDFEEARVLFTGLNTFFGDMAKASSESRNAILDDWKDLGGRNLLIQSLMYAMNDLMMVLKPIKEAFREIFPRQSGMDLYLLTLQLRNFLRELEPSPQTIKAVKTIFLGLFSAIEIGWTVVKNLWEMFGNLFDRFRGNGEGLLSGLAGFAEKIIDLRRALVDGGGIEEFFDKWTVSIGDFIEKVQTKFIEVKNTVVDFITFFRDGFTGMTTNEGEGFLLFANQLGMKLGDVKDKVKKFFDSFSMDDIKGKFDEVLEKLRGWFDTVTGLFTDTDISGKVNTVKGSFDDLGAKFEWLTTLGENLKIKWEELKTKMGEVKGDFETLGTSIGDAFGGIPEKLGETFNTPEWDTLAKFGTGAAFAGVGLFFKQFFDLFKGASGFIKNASAVLKEVTDTLEAMQLKLKAEALLSIAKALALLTASIVILSLLDGEKLVSSMAAMAIGFGYLVTSLALLDKVITGPVGAAKLATLSGALVIIAGAMVVLAAAAAIFATLDWEELAKGIVGVGAMLVALSLASGPLSANSGGMIRAGIGIMAIAVAMNIMALAAKSFAEMNWEEMAQGLAGVGTSLLIVAGAMQLMPDGMLLKGLGMVALATALNIIALAVKSFAGMDWSDMGKGLAGVGASLLIIAGAMHLMPGNMILTGIGLLAIGVGLESMSVAIISLSGLDWNELARGLVGIAGTLVILAAAGLVMQGSIGGAIAIGIMALALSKLATGLKEFAKMKWGDLLKGLGGLALTLGVLAAAAFLMEPLIVPLLALGAALTVVGIAAVLFGTAIYLIATGLGNLAAMGSEGVAVLLEALNGFIQVLPEFIAALGEGLIEIVKRVVAALPEIIPGLSLALQAILQLVIDNIPLIMETLKTLILEGIALIRAVFPELVQLGFDMLMSLLNGIKDNIVEITNTVVDIITNFLDALGKKTPEIIDAVFMFIKDVISGVIEKLADAGEWLLPVGEDILGGLWDGIVAGAEAVWTWFLDLPGAILDLLLNVGDWLLDTGWDLLEGFFIGIGNYAPTVWNWFTSLPGTILGYFTDALTWLKNKGIHIIRGLLDGIKDFFEFVVNWFVDLPGKIGDFFLTAVDWLFDKGWDIIRGLFKGITDFWEGVVTWFQGMGGRIVGWLGDAGTFLLDIGKKIINGLWEGIKKAWEEVKDKILGIFNWVKDKVTGIFDIFSPSRWFMWVGEMMGAGLVIGIDHSAQPIGKAMDAMSRKVTDGFNPDTTSFNDTIRKMTEGLSNMDEFNPVITPVLDLSQVQNGSRNLAGLFKSGASLDVEMSTSQASILATRTRDEEISSDTIDTTGREVTFNQVINSPKALSTSDIYRNTRNQLTMAKEELTR